MTDWILQCSPRVWDVFGWWEQSDEDLNAWTVSQHLGAANPAVPLRRAGIRSTVFDDVRAFASKYQVFSLMFGPPR